ncbi:MAG TPA: hypothetical protein VE172_21970 [Stackebrandtia sp.]|uniref:hypothetical protein n=1 Tax=Stackebrandtia sp. TaxID=2023065 RepID=UPI002D650E3C|nr:hypothetical protein [Stackebrandtia sp.]HZE41477.1 hypothetical protein [Stackebrandtia sp.]
MRIPRTALVVTLTLALGTASAVAWAASGDNTADQTATTPITKELPSSASAKPLLRLDDVAMKAGRPRLIAGKFTATMRFIDPAHDGDRRDMLMSTWITCSTRTPSPDAAYPGRSALSSRNHEGSGRRAVSSVWLFTPPADGTYTCIQWAIGKYTVGPKRSLLPVTGSSDTYLRVAGKTETGGAEWYQGSDAVVRKDDPKTAKREDTATILSHTWTASKSATRINVFHGSQATAGVEGIAGMDPLVLKTTLRITQLNARHQACASAVTAVDKVSIYQGSTHHLKVSRWLQAPVRTGNGCTREFAIGVVAAYTLTHSGATPNKAGTLHGAIRDPLRPYSTAIALNV